MEFPRVLSQLAKLSHVVLVLETVLRYTMIRTVARHFPLQSRPVLCWIYQKPHQKGSQTERAEKRCGMSDSLLFVQGVSVSKDALLLFLNFDNINNDMNNYAL